MADNKEIMAWVTELGQQAFTEARQGDAAMLNRLGTNPALKLFIDNVLGTKATPAHQFPSYYASQWREIARVYEEYKRDEQVTEAVDKVSVLEAKFDALSALLTTFMESQVKPVVEAVEPVKKGKNAAKAEKPVEETETDESAESEA